MKEHKFDKNRRRVRYCPCGKSNRDGKFAPYTGYIDKGYCHSCGQSFWPEKDKTLVNYNELRSIRKSIISYHDPDLPSKYYNTSNENHFTQFLNNKFGSEKANRVIKEYRIGTSDKWKGATVFWQIDAMEHVRGGKIMLYDQDTGKREKSDHRHYISWVHSHLGLPDFNLEQCLFGLHLLNKKDSNKVAIVESEKTAIVMDIVMPEYLWMATGSKGNFNEKILGSVLGKKIVAYPDKGEYSLWHKIANNLNQNGYSIYVDATIEQSNTVKGTDLADIYLDIIKGGGPTSKTPEPVETIPDNPLIYSATKDQANKLGKKNPNIWHLIDAFDLVDENGMEIHRKK